MRPLFHIGKLTWRCGCFACHCLNGLLLLLALLQLAAITLNLIQKEVPVPDKLIRMLVNRIGPGHLQTYWSSAVFDLRAGILLRDFRLLDKSTEQIIASAGDLRIQLAPLHLFFPGINPVRELDAGNVDIYLPVSHSPSGLNEPALRIRHLSLHEQDQRIVVRTLILGTGQFHVQLTGSMPLDLVRRGPAGSGDVSWLKALQAIRRLPPDILLLASVEWHMRDLDDHQLRLTCTIPKLATPVAELSRVLLNASGQWSPAGLALQSASAEGFLNRLNQPLELPLLGQVTGFQPMPLQARASQAGWTRDGWILPATLDITLSNRDPALPFATLVAALQPSSTGYPPSWIAAGSRYFASGRLLPGPAGSGAAPFLQPAGVDFTAWFERVAFSDFFSDPDPDRRLVDASIDRLAIDASIDLPAKALRATSQADGLYIGQTWFANLKVDLLLDPHQLRLSRAIIRKATDETATGSYFQEFASSRFILNAAGAIYPTSLDNILGSWWRPIFTRIRAPQPIAGDVTVWGSWADEEHIQHITSADARGAFYNGKEVPRLQVRVRSNRDWAVIEDLQARFADGRLAGRLAIRSGLADDEAWRAVLLDLDSDAEWEALVAASGVEELRELQFLERNPRVSVRGVVWETASAEAPEPAWSRLTVELVQPEGECRVQGLQVRGLSLQARVDGPSLAIEPLTGQFAGGVFTGRIQLENWQDPAGRVRHFDLELFDAEYASALEQLSAMMDDPDSIRTPLLAEDRAGRLDADILLTRTGMPEVSTGHGFLSIRDAELGRVHLFGGLSRFLDSMGLGFSSLDLEELSADWQLDAGRLAVRNGLVTGPALRLNLAGDIDLHKRLLEMEVNLTLFRGVFGLVMSPVGESLQFDLTGPLESPTWKIRFKPFRWFQNRLAPLASPAGL